VCCDVAPVKLSRQALCDSRFLCLCSSGGVHTVSRTLYAFGGICVSRLFLPNYIIYIYLLHIIGENDVGVSFWFFRAEYMI
jgi:hypothetical protein